MHLIKEGETSKTKGCLSKAWYVDNEGSLYLVKGNLLMHNGGIGYEPISEVIAYKVGKALGLNCLEYRLSKASNFPEVTTYDFDYVSVCRRIEVSKNMQKISVINLMETYYGKDLYTGFWQLYNNIKFLDIQNFINMLIFDAIIGNEDRHFNNWELLIDRNRNIRHSIIYDNGASLLAYKQDNELSLNFKIGPDKAKPFKYTHTRQIALVKKTYPNYNLSINIDSLWYNIRSSIEPELLILDSISHKRRLCIEKYLHNRLYYYIGLFNKGELI